VQCPHHCGHSTNPSVDLPPPSPVTCEQDPEVLKLLHLGQELVPDPEWALQYHFINKSLTWYEAQSFCRLKYTDLATINNMDDENQLINTLDVTSSWIGLYNGQTNRWLWSDGSGVMSFTQWSPGEPSNSGGVEACGEMYDNGLWNDAPCDVTKAYVCYEKSNIHVSRR
uniref:C-type lectin domain-containing protein n=1 Tax=Maylandia zebra TaxID=106582 RepID=A0A3P9D2G3_9CICH